MFQLITSFSAKTRLLRLKTAQKEALRVLSFKGALIDLNAIKKAAERNFDSTPSQTTKKEGRDPGRAPAPAGTSLA